MSEDRVESVVQRIEAALARIADVADTGIQPNADSTRSSDNGAPPNVLALIEKHEVLRETVSNTLEELGELIGEIEQ